MSLKNAIESLAQTFAEGALRAIRSANLEEIVAGGRPSPSAPPGRRARAIVSSTGKGGRLARRSPEELAKVVEAIVGALAGAKDGLRSEQLQKALSVDKKTITRPLIEALASRKIRKTGQKRATKYFAR